MLPFPFHFLNNNQAMNVKPLNYYWRDFYDRVIDLTRYSFSHARHCSPLAGHARLELALVERRARGFDGRLWKGRYYPEIRKRLDGDPQFSPYFEQRERASFRDFYVDMVRQELGPLWEWLPRALCITIPTPI